jgi:hypothetical protein
VEEGITFGGASFLQVNDPAIVGTDELAWSQMSEANQNLESVLAVGNDTGANTININNASGGITSSAGIEIDITAGNGAANSAGGAIDINAGHGGATAGVGGAISITSGNTGGGNFVNAGAITITSGGDGGVGFGNAGNITIRGGDGGARGGNIDLIGGDLTAGGFNAGNITITSGATTSGGSGGNVTIESGSGNSNIGNVNLRSGTSTNAAGGNMNIQTGNGSIGGTMDIIGGDSIANSTGGPINITAGRGGPTTGSGGSLNLGGGNARGGNSAGGAVAILGGTSVGTIVGSNVSITGGAATAAGGNVIITSGNGSSNGDVVINAGDGDITFDANSAAAAIPFNSVADADLDGSLPQNIIGAINALVGGVSPGNQRIAYNLLSTQLVVNNTSNVVVAFFPWIGARYGPTTGLNYQNGVLSYEWDAVDAGTGDLVIDVFINGILSDTATETAASGFGTLAITNGNLPGDANERIDVRVRRSAAGATDPNIYGLVLEFDTST